MVPRRPPLASATLLLAACCFLQSPRQAWGQAAPAETPPSAPSVDSTPPQAVSPLPSPNAEPPAAEEPASAPVLDTWGTPNLPPPTNSPLGVADDVVRSEGLASSAARAHSPSEPDDVDHVRYHLERIEVRGNVRTRPSVILRYLPFRAGRELDVDDTEFTLARYRLLGTGFFRDVEFSIRKGSHRGNVVLVVDVVERNTVVVNGLWLGLAKSAGSRGEREQALDPFGGFDVAETNLAGTGSSLGGAVAIAPDQLALRVRFLDPAFLGTPWMVNLSLLHNRATDFFGNGNAVTAPSRSYELVRYQRFGGSAGVGRDLSMSTQLWFHYRLETITAERPSVAVQSRGGLTESIEFDIQQGRSVFSSARANFQFDTRDHPFLPTRGWFVTTWGELGLKPLGSDYAFQRFDISASYWWHKKNSPHVFRFQLFAGAMEGNIPFFEQYYVGDFSDFLPPRMLSLNVDRRPAPDYLGLGTSIQDVRYGQYAAQIAGEYRVPVYRGHRSVYGIDLFLRAGVFSVANQRYMAHPGPAYNGYQRIPLDFTANAGFRMDTSAGGIVFSLSNVLGFLPSSGGK